MKDWNCRNVHIRNNGSLSSFKHNVFEFFENVSLVMIYFIVIRYCIFILLFLFEGHGVISVFGLLLSVFPL